MRERGVTKIVEKWMFKYHFSNDNQKKIDSSLLKITINSSKLHKLVRIKNLSTKWPYKTNNFEKKHRGVFFPLTVLTLLTRGR
jgi:hypothetical protein